jgi:signal transduction histidine kinase
LYVAAVNARRLLRRHAGDLVVVALAVTAVVEIGLSKVPGSKPLFAVLSLLWTLVLLLRHRYPLAAPVLTTTIVAAASFFEADEMRGTATGLLLLIAASWFLGAGNERRRSIVGLAAMYAGVQVTTAHFGEVDIGDVVFTSLLVGAPWAASQAVRARAAQAVELRARTARLEAERAAVAQTAIAEERTRIARELHDVVAHSISVMTIQAGAARLLLDGEPDKAEEALERVEETGRETLGEMRRLLGVLRRDMTETGGLEPRPSLDHVDALLAQYRAAGLEIALEVAGTRRALPPGVDLAAYRVVQEALTNTLKHAGPGPVAVRIAYAPTAVELEICNDGRNAPSANGRGGGHGLVGMRERTTIYGGSLEAGPRAGGGFQVAARFPLEVGALC